MARSWQPHFTITRAWMLATLLVAGVSLALLVALVRPAPLLLAALGLGAGGVAGGLELLGMRLNPSPFRRASSFAGALRARWSTVPGKTALILTGGLLVVVLSRLTAANALALLAAASGFETARSALGMAGLPPPAGAPPPD